MSRPHSDPAPSRSASAAPDSAGTLRAEASGHMRAERWEDALTTLDALIALEPDEAWAYGSRATVHVALGQAERSLADLARDLEVAYSSQVGRRVTLVVDLQF